MEDLESLEEVWREIIDTSTEIGNKETIIDWTLPTQLNKSEQG